MNRLLIAVLFLLPSLYTFGQEGKNFIDQNYIEVTGVGELEVTPNEIYLEITIREQDNKAKESLEELEKKMLKKLEELGIDTKEQLSVLEFASDFKSRIFGQNIYTSKSYELKLKESRQVPKVFIELESIGISNIQITKVDHSEIDQFKKEVKIEAIKNAKEKAGYLMEAIGQEAGRALYVQEFNYGVFPYAQEARYDMAASRVKVRGAAGDVPDLEFEKIKLKHQVLVRFEIM